MIGLLISEWRNLAEEVLAPSVRKYDRAITAREERANTPQPDLPLEDIKAAAKDFLSRERQIEAKHALEFLSAVFPDRRRNETLLGILLLTTFKRRLPEDTWEKVSQCVDYLEDWDVCDQLAINIAGRLVVERKARFKILQTWTQSTNPLRRRFAVITACVVLKKGGCKPKELLRLIEPLMPDSSKHAQNAVIFAIRNIQIINESMALNLLKRWKGKANHEIFREAMEKLLPQSKMALLKAKSHHE